MNNVKNLTNEKLAVRCRKAKKITVVVTAALMTMVMASMFAMAAFAEGEGGVSVSTKSFISTAGKVLKALIILIGGGIGVWGVVNLVEGYGGDTHLFLCLVFLQQAYISHQKLDSLLVLTLRSQFLN